MGIKPKSFTSTTSISCPGRGSSSSVMFSTPTTAVHPIPGYEATLRPRPSSSQSAAGSPTAVGRVAYMWNWNVCPPRKGVSLSRGGVRYVWRWINPHHFSWLFINDPALSLNVVCVDGSLKAIAMVGNQPRKSKYAMP
jgi:hypothetical protein